MSTPIRVGVAGYGVVGKLRKTCFEKHPDIKIVGVCDRNLTSGTFVDGVPAYNKVEELFELPLDILVVCLTNDVAALVTSNAIQKNLHVFCEKPPGRNLDEIASVLKIHRQNPSKCLMYGFNHRYHESVVEAQSIIQSGNFGKVLNMRGVYGKAKMITFSQSDWRTRREIAGGGVLLDQGIHMVDLMRLFGGEFQQINSHISNDFWKYSVEDNAYALMQSNSGVIAMLHSSATQWRHRFNLEINLERGSLTLGGILSGSKSYGAETLLVVYADPDKDKGDPRETLIRYNSDPSWDSEVSYFLDCVRKGNTINHSSVEDAFKTMQLVYRIYYADPLWREKYNIANPDEVIYE